MSGHDLIRPSLDRVHLYEPGKRIADVRDELGLTEIAKLSSNESPFPPTPKALAAMGKALKGLNRYPDGACRLLRGKLVEYLNVPPQNLVVGNGSNELLRLLGQILLEPGDEVIMAVPSFIVYPLVARLMDAKPVEVPLRDFTHDLEAMAAAVTGRTKLIFICNPNNPTGTTVSYEACRAFLRKLPEEVVVCFDEAYHEYVVHPDYRTAVDLRSDHPNVVVFRTFSKIYGLAGARIGYGVAPEPIVQAIDKTREPFNVNTVAQIGAFFALDEQAEVKRRLRFTLEQKAVLYQALSRLGRDYVPSETNFIYIDTGIEATEAFERMKRQGVIVRAFGRDRHVRATLGSAHENHLLIKALEGF